MYRIQNKAFSFIRAIFFTLFIVLFAAPVFANEEAPKEKKFNAGQTIIEHITDSHDWHLWGHTAIHLPVILYSSDRGLEVFSSGRFEHGEQDYNGYKLLTSEYMLEHPTLNKNKYHAQKIVRTKP